MDLSDSQKQNLIYFCLIILTAISLIPLYYFSKPQWINYRKGENYFNEKNFQQAAKAYELSLTQGKTTYQTHLHLAQAYVAEHNFSKAADNYRAYLTLFPNDHKIRLEYARTLFWNGDLNGAEEEYKKLEESP